VLAIFTHVNDAQERGLVKQCSQGFRSSGIRCCVKGNKIRPKCLDPNTTDTSGFCVIVVSTLGSGTQVRGPKPSDFSGDKILSMPSLGGEVKPSVPCRSFAACQRIQQLCGSRIVWLNLTGHFWPMLPPFTNRGLSLPLAWSASGDERGN
jgi:hypothetical protein